MKRSIITLLTDFGTRDHYVASMKGVILGINPGCTVIDISHEIGAQEVEDGAFVLANAFSHFPPGTIHVGVVDPGVGGPRKPILVVTRNYIFLGPDNGLLMPAASRDGIIEARELAHKEFFLLRVSSTFHGRDIFAPAAAHLSTGLKPRVFGPKLKAWVNVKPEEPKVADGRLVAAVVHVDVFGNVITNISASDLLAFTGGKGFRIDTGKWRFDSLKKGYWEGKKDHPIALIGSSGLLEFSVNNGSAQTFLKVRRGQRIRIIAGP
jgi:S-adenosyl-L-methionine hydrolase (adenosine-forming)